MMQRVAVVVVLLGLGGLGTSVRGEPEPTTEEILEAIASMKWSEALAYLDELPEASLERLLDRYLENDGSGWRHRAVSVALGWKILDRRTARLRALAPPDGALEAAPRLGVLDYPKTDGSTSTIPLERLLACRLLRSPYAWGGPKTLRGIREPFVATHGGFIGVGRSKEPTLAARAARGGIVADVTAPDNERLAAIINGLLVRHTGTHGAWVSLIEGKADLIFVARAASADEEKLAAEKGVSLDALPVARDAFVFLVHRSNPLESLTLDQIRGVYTEAIRTWEEVGALSGKIEAYQRDRNSGSQELFLERVMRDAVPTTPDRNMIHDSMMGPLNAVARRPRALGYTVWYYERYMALLPEVKPIAIGGVSPTPEAIADGTYPIVTTVYAAVRADAPAEGTARRLRDWLRTDVGQRVVAESGYLPVR